MSNLTPSCALRAAIECSPLCQGRKVMAARLLGALGNFDGHDYVASQVVMRR